MNKYIIKNCPNLTTSFYSTGEIVHNQCGCSDDDMCKDINNCLLKRIIEKCKEAKLHVRRLEYEDSIWEEYSQKSELATEILDLLEIKECEDE